MSSSPFSVGLSITRSVAGVGLLAMPYALRQAGYIPATVLFILVWSMTVRTTIQLAKCALSLNRAMCPLDGRGAFDPKTEMVYNDDGEDDVVTLVDICSACFGDVLGARVAWAALMPCQWVIAVNYMIFCGQNTSSAFMGAISPNKMILGVAILQCALCAPRSTGYLVHTSSFGNVAFVAGFGSILYYALFVHGHVGHMIPVEPLSGTFEAFGILVFGFSAYAETIAVLSSANSTARRHIATIIFVVQSISLLFFLGFSFSVYAAFGDATRAISFDNLPQSNAFIRGVRLCMTMMIVTTYPLVIAPFFQVLEASLVDPADTPMRILSRSTVIFTTIVAAYLCGDSFGPMTAIGGGLGAILGFVIPPMCYQILFPEKRTRFGTILNYLSVFIGLAGLVASCLGGLHEISTVPD